MKKESNDSFDDDRSYEESNSSFGTATPKNKSPKRSKTMTRPVKSHFAKHQNVRMSGVAAVDQSNEK